MNSKESPQTFREAPLALEIKPGLRHAGRQPAAVTPWPDGVDDAEVPGEGIMAAGMPEPKLPRPRQSPLLSE